jgi:hypothetical protein
MLSDQAVVFAVHQEAEMREEVGTCEWMCVVGYQESPSEIPA